MVSAVYQIEVEPVSELIPLDGMEGKIQRMVGCVGLKLLSLKQIQKDQAESNQARLVEWVRQQDGSVSVRDVQRAFGFKTANDAENALRVIVDSGCGEWVNLATNCPGRPAWGIQLTTAEQREGG
ncbi:hypothetical protein CA11_33310 [Gimesia maris]|uniref:hypothetical protein n=1 Tax=Gimesia maris TaxID=122 RepID=UPI00118BFFAC|nr:hypothetical protein [Gimesia maris]QDU15506.1 hypothetical protein CA11_33310 [Gimesia maris]